VNRPSYSTILFRGVLWGLLLSGGAIFADLADVQRLEEVSRSSFNDRFSTFTKDKNVMGKAVDSDGKVVSTGAKARFDHDDDNPFQSELTYHDFSYEVRDHGKDNRGNINPNEQVKTLYAGISHHGAIDKGGGSSLLERTAYQLHEQFTKAEDDRQKQQADEQKGIQYRSIFKVETKDVQKTPGAAAPATGATSVRPKNNDTEPDKVERWTIRDEAKPGIENVGKISFETIDRAAKDPDSQDDPKEMGNLRMYYHSAKEAVKALWRSTLANLAQRWNFKAIEPQTSGENVQLSEDYENPKKWAEQVKAKLDKERPPANPTEKQERDQEIEKMAKQAEQVGALSYHSIDPQFKQPNPGAAGPGAPAGGPVKEQLVMEGPEKEDARVRDWRVQLEVLGKGGISASQVPSNWKYNQKDDAAAVATQFDNDGNPTQTQDLSVAQQIQLYNNDLKSAAEAIPPVKDRFPDLKADPKKILSYQIQPGSRSVVDLNQFPADAVYEGYEAPIPESQTKPTALPQNYQELLQKKGE
jgi:hypothetical protein